MRSIVILTILGQLIAASCLGLQGCTVVSDGLSKTVEMFNLND